MKNELTKIFKQKEARRKRLAKLSFEEKVEIIERLRQLDWPDQKRRAAELTKARPQPAKRRRSSSY